MKVGNAFQHRTRFENEAVDNSQCSSKGISTGCASRAVRGARVTYTGKVILLKSIPIRNWPAIANNTATNPVSARGHPCV